MRITRSVNPRRSGARAGNFCLATAVSLVVASTAARADDARPAEEMHVEGKRQHALQSRKFTAPLLDTPKSVTVIDQALIEQRNATSLVDALRSVPGITFNAGEGGQPHGDNLKIRGFDAGSDVYIDGVRDAGSQTRDIFALEQIEVIKGPGSVYGGRGSSGGIVNLATKTAHEGTSVSGTLAGGTDAYRRGTADVNLQFADSAALRLNLLAHDADLPGRDAVSIEHRGAAPSLTLGLGTPTRLTADYYYYRTDDVPDYSFPYGRNADNSAAAGEPVVIDRDNFYGLSNRDFQKTGADVGTIRIEHAFNEDLRLTNTTRIGRTSNDYIVTNPDDSRANVANGFVLRNSKSRNSITETVANQTDLSGVFETGRVRHRFSAGIELSREQMENRNYVVENLFTGNALSDPANSCSAPGAVGAASGYSCTTLADPDPDDPWSGLITRAEVATDVETNTASVYAFDTLELDERWSLNLGLRYDDYETEQTSASGEAESNDAFLNYQVGVVYKPLPYGSVYVSTGTSSNPSGNTLGDGTENLTSGNADLEPERDRTVEIGTKWTLADGRADLTAALFRTEKRNARVAIEPGRGAPEDTVGEQRVDGFELGLDGRLTDAWQMSASYTWLDSEIIDDGPIGTDEGNAFPNTPEHSFSLWTSYALTDALSVGGGAFYVDQRFGNTANTVWVADYWRYDLMAAYRVNEHVDLQLNVQNLTDEEYFDRPFVTHYAAIAPARSVVLTASFEL